MNISFLQRSKVISVTILLSLVSMHSDMRSDSKQLDEISYLREDTHVADSVARLHKLVRALRPDAPETESIGILDELCGCVCVIRNNLDEVLLKLDDCSVLNCLSDLKKSLKKHDDTMQKQHKNIKQKVDTVLQAIEELEQSINNKLDVLQNDVDMIKGNLGNIQGDLDNIQGDLEEINDKVCDIQNTANNIDDQSEEILNKVCGIDRKTDDIDDILSKVCDIDSKVDNIAMEVDVELDDEFEEVNSKLDVIQSKVCDIDAALCDPIIITQSDVELTIITPGTYIVGGNLMLTNATVITIEADGVILDLCGNKLEGASGTGILVGVGHKNIVIKNGLLTNFDTGLKVERGCSNITIDNIDITNCATRAIHFNGDGTYGEQIINSEIKNCGVFECLQNITGDGVVVLLECCNSVKINNCRVNNNGSTTANPSNLNIIKLDSCTKCELKDVEAHCNTAAFGTMRFFVLDNSTNNLLERCSAIESVIATFVFGFFFMNSNRNIIKDCRAIELNSDGFLVEGSNDCVFEDCQALNNNSEGFKLGISDNCVLKNCQASNNDSEGFFLSSSVTNCVFKDCQASNNTDNGFTLEGSSTDCVFENCQASNNNFNGFKLGSSGNCVLKNCQASNNNNDGFLLMDSDNCELKDCQALNNSGDGFEESASSTNNLYIRNIACGNGGQNYNNISTSPGAPVTSPANARGVDNVDCILTDEDQVDVIESKVCDIESKVCIIDAALCDPIIINEANTTISAAGTYVVGKDLELAAAGTVITIDVDGVILDLCGNKLEGASGTGILVTQNHANIVIKNGLLNGLATGLKVEKSCSNITIDNINITDCDTRAIHFAGDSGNEILNSEIKNCNVFECLQGITGGTSRVVFLERCNSVKMNNCRVNNNGSTTANPSNLNVIELNNCKKCELKDVEAHCNAAFSMTILHFFRLNTSTNNLFERCSAIESVGSVLSDGFFFGNNSNFNIIKDCRAINLSTEGFSLNTSVSCVFKNCQALRNSLNGFHLDTSFNCVLKNCQASNQGENGFLLEENSDNCVLKNCQALNNDIIGFHLKKSDDCILENCQALDGNCEGFKLSNTSDNCELKDCQASANDIGFDLNNSGNCVFESCQALNNDNEGFLLDNSSDCMLKDCQALNNKDGFSESGTSSDNLYIRNIACGNTNKNYKNISPSPGAPITSPANARGADNIDCDSTDDDTVDIIESKVCDIQSKIDFDILPLLEQIKVVVDGIS